MSNTTRPTVALVRVSTSEQTTAPQRQAVAAWASAQGVEIAQTYAEEATSGAATKRPGLDALLRDARRGKVGRVVVAELSRVSRRGLAHVATVLDELTACGVTLVSLREGIDSGTPMGRAMMQMASIFAELERSHLRDRTRAGLIAAKRRGKTLGRPSLVFSAEELDDLRAMRAAGRTWAEIEGSEFRVFDARGRAVKPSGRAMRRALAG